MPQYYSIVVEVDRADDLGSAWLALLAGGLKPSLPTVPLKPGHDHGPLLVWVKADTPVEAEAHVREILGKLGGSFSVARIAL